MADAWQNLLRCGSLSLALCDTIEEVEHRASRDGKLHTGAVMRLLALCEELRISTAWALCLDTADVRAQVRARMSAERAAA